MKRRDLFKGVLATASIALVGLFTKGATAAKPVMNTPSGLTPEAMAGFFGEIKSRDQRVHSVWVNPDDYWQIPKNFEGRCLYDRIHSRRILRMGILGFLWGAEVRISNKIPKGHICLQGEATPHPGMDWDFCPPNPNWTPLPEEIRRFA